MSDHGWAPPSGPPEPVRRPQLPPPDPHGQPAPYGQPVPAPRDDAAGAPAQAWQSRPYQQLLRGPRHRWWRPLVALSVVLGCGVVLVVGIITAGAIAVALNGVNLSDDAAYQDAIDRWSVGPWGLLITNLALAALILVAMLAVWAGHRWPPGYASSVLGRVRWRWLLVALLAAAVVAVPINVGLAFLDGTPFDPEPRWLALSLVVLVSTPLQAAGEEYFFRGWLPGAIGSWFARPLWSVLVGGLVSTALFGLAHGDQNVWLFTDRFAFGAIATWLVWRTGGLEAGIAMHTVNNLIAFGFSIGYGDLEDSVNVSTAGAVEVGLDVAVLGLSALVLVLLARRRGMTRKVPPGWPQAGS